MSRNHSQNALESRGRNLGHEKSLKVIETTVFCILEEKSFSSECGKRIGEREGVMVGEGEEMQR